jgi:hypothetical protein
MTTQTFVMDCSEHIVGDPDCCSCFGARCSCGHLIHFEAIYGGQYYECEHSHATGDLPEGVRAACTAQGGIPLPADPDD